MNSDRNRIRVIGVRRSWLIAASTLVRSSIRLVMRSRMRLSAFAAERISSGPRSGSGDAAPSRLKLSAAFAKADSGAVSARAAHSPSSVMLMTANNKVIIHGPPKNGGPCSVGAQSCGDSRAVGQRNGDPLRIAVAVERDYPIGVAEASVEVVQCASIGFASYSCAAGYNVFDPELREGAGNTRCQSLPLRCWRGAKQLDGAGELCMPAVARRLRLVRTVHEE